MYFLNIPHLADYLLDLVVRVLHSLDAGIELQMLLHCQLLVKDFLLIADADLLGLVVDGGDEGFPRGRPAHFGDNVHQSGLTSPITTQQPEYLGFVNLGGDAVEGHHIPIILH